MTGGMIYAASSAKRSLPSQKSTRLSTRARKGRRTRHRKAAGIRKARKRLLQKIADDAEHKTMHSRVGLILALYPHTRDSDVELCNYYWKIFHPDIVDTEDRISLSDLHRVERPTSIVRTRQKIQNEFRLFVASEEVQRMRQELAGKKREAQLQEKPAEPVITAVCDESGKNERYAIIGSVWANDPKRYYEIVADLVRWKGIQQAQREFHFSELRKGDVASALEFINEGIRQADALCFKAVLVDQTTVQTGRAELFNRLHNQLCIRGIEHERDHGRTVLPRTLTVIKDAEDGQDKLYLTELKQRLSADLVRVFRDEIHLASLEVADSALHPLVQMADLLSGSLNRVLNYRTEGGARNHKDEFADEMLRRLGLDPQNAAEESDQDFVMVCRL